jgi:hypothetical protein
VKKINKLTKNKMGENMNGKKAREGGNKEKE